MTRRRPNFWAITSIPMTIATIMWGWISWKSWQEGLTAVSFIAGGIAAFVLISWLILLLLVRRKV